MNELARAQMIYIPAGAALVGSDAGSEAEKPRRQIELPGFWIDATPVTNADFAGFVRQASYKTEVEQRGSAWGWKNGHFGQIEGLSWRSYAVEERANHPVVLVTWEDANAYARWRGKRLPSEFEWEAAASGGLQGNLYPWGAGAPDGTQCNWNRTPSDLPPTTPVDAFPPSESGLFDLVGNVWQWCSGELAHGSGDSSTATRPRRGGGWNVVQDFRLRCSNRGALPAGMATPNLGFRCAADF